MRMIPPEPDFGDHQTAERAVWEILKNHLPDNVVLAHSVSVKHGSAEHEIDILVLWPNVGVAAIEVKGGYVGCQDGQWWQSDSKRGKSKLRDPFAQSQGAIHALNVWLQDHLGQLISHRSTHMVALPYSTISKSWAKAGNPRELLLDEGDLKNPAGLIRRAIENHGGAKQPLAPKFLERIYSLLSGDTGADSSALAPSAVREQEDFQDNLTERQRILLQATRSLPRVRFTGGAGSGKTWLALEKARTLARDGQRVALLCYNKGLAMYLQDHVNKWRSAKPAFTGEFHEYAKKVGVSDGSGQSYFDETMPQRLAELAVSMPTSEKFDAIIVDEAQDFAPLWWQAVRACLREPADGKLFAFMDNQQDVYQRWTGADPIADLVPIHVDDNMRNTVNIANVFKGFASEGFKPRGGQGVPVRYVECNTSEAVDVADDCVLALINDGWSANQIALLTTKNRHNIHNERFVRDDIKQYWREFHDAQQEFYGHVLGFKGLERSVVVLCVDGFKSMERASELLYVGLSRARSLLVVVGELELLSEVGGQSLSSALMGATPWQPPSG